MGVGFYDLLNVPDRFSRGMLMQLSTGLVVLYFQPGLVNLLEEEQLCIPTQGVLFLTLLVEYYRHIPIFLSRINYKG